MTYGGRPHERGHGKKASEKKRQRKGEDQKASAKLKKWLPIALGEQRGC
jgi:hypothetical protein